MDNDEIENIDYVICAICGNRYHMISPTHMKKHGISMAEYQKKFPNSLITPLIITKKKSDSLSGRKVSDETRAKMSKSAKLKPPMSDEQKMKMSKALTGKKHTPESIQKMRDKKNRWNKNHPDYYKGEGNSNFGKITPDHVKAKISATILSDDTVNHHYIYDHNDLTKYTMKMKRAAHTKLHWLMRKAEIEIPHINIKSD